MNNRSMSCAFIPTCRNTILIFNGTLNTREIGTKSEKLTPNGTKKPPNQTRKSRNIGSQGQMNKMFSPPK
jgi:hypothetical protein